LRATYLCLGLFEQLESERAARNTHNGGRGNCSLVRSYYTFAIWSPHSSEHIPSAHGGSRAGSTNISCHQNVASTLLTRGRLPLLQLVRFTGLKPRVVRQAVLVLVQHNIIWHAETEDDGEVLEVNTDECLTRLRFGRYVWQAEQLCGQAVSILNRESLRSRLLTSTRARRLYKWS
jgi:hypothetical protein